MFFYVGILLLFPTFMQCLRLGVHTAVEDVIEETNATNILIELERLSVNPPPQDSVVGPRRSVLPPSDR